MTHLLAVKQVLRWGIVGLCVIWQVPLWRRNVVVNTTHVFGSIVGLPQHVELRLLVLLFLRFDPAHLDGVHQLRNLFLLRFAGQERTFVLRKLPHRHFHHLGREPLYPGL